MEASGVLLSRTGEMDYSFEFFLEHFGYEWRVVISKLVKKFYKSRGS